jgi:hypothetical protein
MSDPSSKQSQSVPEISAESLTSEIFKELSGEITKQLEVINKLGSGLRKKTLNTNYGFSRTVTGLADAETPIERLERIHKVNVARKRIDELVLQLYKKHGDTVSISDLAACLNMARTTLREKLMRFQRQGLL